MNEIQIFKNNEFGEIRVSGTSEKPMFCLTDVCHALDIKNVSDCKSRLNTKGIDFIDTLTNGGKQRLTFVDEGNLYRCIFGSRKENATEFQDWVTDEVLPSIRKTGSYSLNVPKTFAEALRLAADQQEQLEKQQKQLEEQHPKVVFADAVVSSTTSILVGELAKMISQNGYEIGQNRLFKWLRDHNYLCKYGERRNIPYQQFIEQGLFTLKTNTYSVNGEMKTKNTVKVTQKGCMYFINKFIKK